MRGARPEGIATLNEPVRRRLLIAIVAALCVCGPAGAATGRTSGDPLQGQEWWLTDIGADQVAPPGPGVPITIVDSGVDPTHPEFAGRANTFFLNGQTVDGRPQAIDRGLDFGDSRRAVGLMHAVALIA